MNLVFQRSEMTSWMQNTLSSTELIFSSTYTVFHILHKFFLFKLSFLYINQLNILY